MAPRRGGKKTAVAAESVDVGANVKNAAIAVGEQNGGEEIGGVEVAAKENGNAQVTKGKKAQAKKVTMKTEANADVAAPQAGSSAVATNGFDSAPVEETVNEKPAKKGQGKKPVEKVKKPSKAKAAEKPVEQNEAPVDDDSTEKVAAKGKETAKKGKKIEVAEVASPKKRGKKNEAQKATKEAETEEVAVATASKKRGKKNEPKKAEPTTDDETEEVAPTTSKGKPKAQAKTTKAKPAAKDEAPSTTTSATKGKAKTVAKAKPEKVVETKPNDEAGPSDAKKGAKRKAKEEKPVAVAKSPKRVKKQVAAESKSPEKPVKSKATTSKRGAAKAKANDVDDAENSEDEVAEPSPEEKLPKSRKRAAPVKVQADSTSADDALVTKRPKATKKAAAEKKEDAPKVNATTTDYSKIDFSINEDYSLKICSWNVAGLRALANKNGIEYFKHENPDIICLQEIKCLEDQVPQELKEMEGYHPYWCSTPGGRGGVAILTKQMAYNVEYNIGDEELDEEGRIITAEYSKYYLICVYVPNAGRGLKTLDLRLRWNKLFEQHVSKLKAKKPVIICGDMNVAHNEIDLKNPKTNTKSAGFTKEEREGMTDLLHLGFIDTFRHLYPNEENAYTFWSFMNNARAKNIGWRLDYALVSENLLSKVVDCYMRPQVMGSDHCPINLLLNF